METTDKKFISKVIDERIGYFKFLNGACEKAFESAFEDYMRIVSDEKVDKLIVAVEITSWNDVIENLWIQTGEMAEKFGIKKWGIVTPDSAIRKMTLRRVVKRLGYDENPMYQFFLSENEADVMDWISQN